MSNHFEIIDNFTLETSCDDIESVASEVTALKMAVGLFFRSLPAEHKIAHINTLESFDHEDMRRLATFLRQFMNTQKTANATDSIN